MPFFDRRCESCGTEVYDVLEPSNAPVVLCGECGEPTVRAWLTKPAYVIGDEMDHTQINGLKHPRRFTSKQEHARWMKANGFRIKDDHVGSQGSDKNKFTQRWAGMDPQTLKNAQDLVARAASAPATSSEEDGPRGITSNDGIMRYLQDRSRNERGDVR